MTQPVANTTISAEADPLFRAISDAADNANIGVVVIQRNANDGVDISYSNRTTEALLGYSNAQIIERGFWSFVPAAERLMVLELQAARLRGEEVPRTYKVTLAHRTGREVPTEIAVGSATLGGRPAMVLFLIDISARRAAEEALRRSQALFQQVVTNAPDGIYILRWPIVLYANPAGARILEFERPEDVTGLNLTDRMSADDLHSGLDRPLGARGPGQARDSQQYRGVTPSGRAFAVEVSSIPIDFEGGPASLAFARDVTERNAILLRLREAEKLSAVSALAAGVAHEINNPLAYVLLNLEFIMRELPELGGDPIRTEALQRRLTDTRHGAERVKSIVRDLQALTRKDEGIRGPVELDQVLEHAISLVERSLPKGARIVREFESVPCVLGNATRLEQLFWNLLVNAVHAIEAAPGRDHVLRVSLTAAHDGHVITEVEDDGCGMPQQVLLRAFEPFFSTKPQGVGAGLGLAICKRIVDDMEGQIAIESRDHAGTRVRVWLPSCESAQPEVSAPAKPRGRVLVVDDERAVAESLQHALRDEHDVDTAVSAQEARAAFARRGDYDVVLCDLAMPVESGAELYAYTVTNHPELAQRFVFMTGGAFTQKAADFLEANQRPHIEKPFALDRLRALVEQFVERR